MLDDFKKFALRGNVVDLAIGVIIGAAFGAIVPRWWETSSCLWSAQRLAGSISPITIFL